MSRKPNYLIDRGVIGYALAALLLLVIGMGEGSPTVALAQATQPQPGRPQQLQPTTEPKQSPKPPELGEEEVEEARELLAALGYWLNPDADGLDASLRHAVIAFQKIEGRPRTGILNQQELAALRQARRPQARETGDPHIEVDLSRQILFVVDDAGSISRILSVSTGSGQLFTEGGKTRRAVTPAGRFTITYKIGGKHQSPLGSLYYPNYLHDGIAIHGNPSVPARPASHGCIRIPMFAAKEFYQTTNVGTVVLVYDSSLPASVATSSVP